MSETFWQDCPDVQVDPEKLGGEPTVGPYRVAARTVIESDDLGSTPEEIADDFGLPLKSVKAVLGFYHARQHELTLAR